MGKTRVSHLLHQDILFYTPLSHSCRWQGEAGPLEWALPGGKDLAHSERSKLTVNTSSSVSELQLHSEPLGSYTSEFLCPESSCHHQKYLSSTLKQICRRRSLVLCFIYSCVQTDAWSSQQLFCILVQTNVGVKSQYAERGPSPGWWGKSIRSSLHTKSTGTQVTTSSGGWGVLEISW